MPTIIRAGGGQGNINNVVILDTSTTWTVPSGISKFYLWMCGGGCQGGQYNTSGSSYDYYIGGISSMPREYVVEAVEGTTYTAVIGAGGVSAGGKTSFGSYTASGGTIIPQDMTYQGFGNAQGGVLYKDGGVNGYAALGGEGGNAGTLDAFGHSENRGYCWITDEIYCGGGAVFLNIASDGTHPNGWSWSTEATAPAAGGGPALPATTLSNYGHTTVYEFSYTGSITPANKYGAGGVFVYSWATLYGDFIDPTKLAPYQGVVIIGY